MLEIWLKLKIFFDYIIPAIIIGIIILIFIIFIIHCIIDEARFKRKIKLLKRNNFKRYLIDVASMGGGAWYGWEKDNYKYKISEKELYGMSYKKLKKWLKAEDQS